MSWEQHAASLAGKVTHRGSRWRGPVGATPRHLLVPRWWDQHDQGKWTLRDGPASEAEWMRAAYSDQTLVTEVGGLHADHARPGDQPPGLGRPTSSSTLPGLVVQMLDHAQVFDGADVLDVATGSGYSAALLSHSLGDDHVTSADINPYLTEAAAQRLHGLGLAPKIITCDATGPLPGSYDRIVSMTSVRPVPASWLAALRPGGRLVTVIARTGLILTADKTEGGEWAATGRIEWDRAWFMPARDRTGGGTAYPDVRHAVDAKTGGDTTTGRYPVLKVADSWELVSLLEVTTPGIEHDYHQDDDGRRTAWMLHPDGSWARATAKDEHAAPEVRQGGPRRLWDILDDHREYWLRHGYFQLYGARAFIPANGSILLARGRWKAAIKAASR
jgi:protein-L-isoaspartate O-methyltransferase